MADIESSLAQKLSTDPGMQNIFGARIYPLQGQPRDTYPRLDYKVLSNEPLGSVGGPVADANALIQVDMHAQNYGQMKAARAALSNLVNGASGNWPGGVWIHRALFDADADLEQPLESAKSKAIVTEQVGVRIFYAIPGQAGT